MLKLSLDFRRPPILQQLLASSTAQADSLLVRLVVHRTYVSTAFRI